MGCEPGVNGVRVTFVEKTDEGVRETRPQVEGKYCAFFSEPRPIRRNEDDPTLGSQDWLTHVLVTDHPDKLAALLPEGGGSAETSCSSRNVLVRWWVGEDRGMVERAVTISECPAKGPNGKIPVERMTVMPEGTDPLELPQRLAGQWRAGVPRLQ